MAASDAAHLVGPSEERSLDDGRLQHDSAPSAIVLAADDVPLKCSTTIAARLRKHADYQRTYKASRKQFSSSMTFFYAPQLDARVDSPRVGITAGRVLGNAVERNRIKRRMREAIRANQTLLPAGIDVILHPRRSVLETNYAELRLEVGRIFSKIAAGAGRVAAAASDSNSVANRVKTPFKESTTASGKLV